LLLAVGVALASVAVLAYWDEERDSAAALSDLAREQVSIARGVASALTTNASSSGAPDRAVLWNFRSVERDRALRLFLLRPGAESLVGTDYVPVSSAPVVSAAAAGLESVRLPRDEAAALGLPNRTALVGLAEVTDGVLSGWQVAAAGSAWRERDRERWAYVRLVLSVLTAGGLVLLFGGMALRTQRKELGLERELALSESREQQNDRLERANRVAALGTLAMGVAHEISTPLAVIAGRSEQILLRTTDERSTAAARVILEQTQRINQVIRGLLGLARGDWMAAEGIAPSSAARAAIAMVEHRFAKAGVVLSANIAPDLPSVHGDASLLENALVNLLLNACDACPNGGHVRVAVTADARVVRFCVIDDGAGISTSDAGKVFEPLFTTKPNGAGTGLGLALANEIVKSHRGTLTLAAATPRGTEASVEIPLAVEAVSAA
jgi:two-component system NtrC family sensor kinase